jgi:bifunctional non-homologous end joining protein LigD
MPAKKPTSAKAGPSPSLAEYERKRDFTKTAEPRGKENQVHKAAGLRGPETRGDPAALRPSPRAGWVMKSWAVPKGPASIPPEKRLAMEVEDHPIEYNAFEGIIPRDNMVAGP